jgi:DNA-binding transcriptional MerR regulator
MDGGRQPAYRGSSSRRQCECRELIELYDPTSGNQKQLHSMLAKIAERREQLEQQMLDIEQMKLELDTAEERCIQALEQTIENQKVGQ